MSTTQIIKYKGDDEVTALIRAAYKPELFKKPELLPASYDSFRKIVKKSDNPNIDTICKAVIVKMLLSINKAAFGNNVDRYMSEEQAAEITVLLFEDFGDLNVTEFGLVARGIKKGKYGKLYGSFTSDFVCQAFQSYRDERGKNLNKAQSLKNEERMKEQDKALEGVKSSEEFAKYNEEIKEKYDTLWKWLRGENPNGLIYENVLKHKSEITFESFRKMLSECRNKGISLIRTLTVIENYYFVFNDTEGLANKVSLLYFKKFKKTKKN